MKTNTNSYTIIYSVVLVVVVALMLASVYQALKPQQDANVMLDTQKQILYALNQDRDMTNEEAAKLWQNLVEADDMIDANGNVVEAGKQGGTEAGFPAPQLRRGQGRQARRLPLQGGWRDEVCHPRLWQRPLGPHQRFHRRQWRQDDCLWRLLQP